jgi:hypothetical protein
MNGRWVEGRTKQAREISAKIATMADNWNRCLVHILWTLQVRNSWLSPHTFYLTEQKQCLLSVGIQLDHEPDDGKPVVWFPAESRDILFSKTPGQYLLFNANFGLFPEKGSRDVKSSRLTIHEGNLPLQHTIPRCTALLITERLPVLFPCLSEFPTSKAVAVY